ncbi:MAG: HAD family hydrolase [Thermoplasmataceae archaeon]
MPEAKTVFFDLDDTLTDYAYARIYAFVELKNHFSELINAPLFEMDRVWTESWYRFLPSTPIKTDSEMMLFRSRRLGMVFEHFGMKPHKQEITDAVRIFTDSYDSSLSPVPGAKKLLYELKKKHTLICVITNNPTVGQARKLELCGLSDLVDILVTSGEVGVSKPDSRIFEFAMTKADTIPSETVMVGDTWEQDIVGAINAGIRAVWLNRFSVKMPVEVDHVREISSYVPLGPAINAILG